eukprot:199791-Pyramimonas_sp.AAC.1
MPLTPCNLACCWLSGSEGGPPDGRKDALPTIPLRPTSGWPNRRRHFHEHSLPCVKAFVAASGICHAFI